MVCYLKIKLFWRFIVNIVLLGKPGSGKGSLVEILLKSVGCQGMIHISTGNILRQNIKDGTELGQLIQSYTEQGQLVPDEVIIDLVRDRLSQSDVDYGFILDGFPRTVAQAEALTEMTKLDLVVNLQVSDKEIIRRLSGRRTCRQCGSIYHTDSIGDPMVCEKCEGELFIRSDDKLEAIAERLQVYRVETDPLVNFYKKQGILCRVRCTGKSREEVSALVWDQIMVFSLKKMEENIERIFANPEARRELAEALAEGRRIGEQLRKASIPTYEQMHTPCDI